MRDLVAILVLVAVVVSLGIFRVPNENALLEAGLRAEAQAALAETRHPLAVTAKGHVLTVSGRVESAAARSEVLARLTALEGVDRVVDMLTLLPEVAPFVLDITRGEDVTYTGHLQDAALGDRLADTLGVAPDLPLGAGAPEGFGVLAAQAAQALVSMRRGRARITDTALVLTGEVHLPSQRAAIEALFGDLPEGLTADLHLRTLDDGLPYSLLITRDPLMGQEIRGKLPPDFDISALDGLGPMQVIDVQRAPLPLDQPGFEAAFRLSLPVFSRLDQGSLTVAPGAVTLTGGTVDLSAEVAALRAALPPGHALNVALVPPDAGGPLTLRLDWADGALKVSGRVPRDFALAAPAPGVTMQGSPDRSPYPDLSGWADPLGAGLEALLLLTHGMLVYDETGLRVSGEAANPKVQAATLQALGAAGMLDVTLADDGLPAAFRLDYDLSDGGGLSGKLPVGLTLHAFAQALGLRSLSGEARDAPGSPDAAARRVLRMAGQVAPMLPYLDGLTMTFDGDALSAKGEVTSGIAPAAWPPLPSAVQLSVAKVPPDGSLRRHDLLAQDQRFEAGYWRPELPPMDAARCAEVVAELPDVPFDAGRLSPALSAHWPLAEIAEVARQCGATTGAVFDVLVTVARDEVPGLDRQRARRRAEALRAALVARGVPATGLSVMGHVGDRDATTYGWR